MVGRTGRLAWRSLAAAIAILLAASAPSASQAAWLKAETDRFIVYSDGRERELADFATQLIIFDAMLRKVYQQTEAPPATNKFEIFLVRGRDQLHRILPDAPYAMRGYYAAQPSGIYAVAKRTGNDQLATNEVLFHEYMHRVMLETSSASYPAWLVEAYAEYFQTARIRGDYIELGHQSRARLYALQTEASLPWDEVLGKPPEAFEAHRQSTYYAQAWMLLHYMLSDSARTQQLDAAVRSIAAGQAPVEAFHKATNMDNTALTKALLGYRTATLVTRRVPNPLRERPAVSITQLPPSADGLLLEAQRIIDGVPRAEQAGFLAMIQGQAGRFRGDRFAELTLARAEANYGDAKAARAIVDRWLAKAPEEAEILRAAADIHMAASQRDPEHRKDHLRAARPYLVKARQTAPSDFRILYDYAVTRTVEPGFPDEDDIDGLLQAHKLAPSVQPITLLAAQALIYRGRKDEARQLLEPVANAPHGGEMTEQARRLLHTGRLRLIVPNAEGLQPAAP